LRVADEHVHRGFEPAWVVQTGGGQADDAAFGIFRAGDTRAAFGAEAAQVVSAVQAGRGVMLQRALGELEMFQRHNNDGRVRSAADLLAIAAMAFEHHQGTRTAFVADFAANAAAGEWKFHQKPTFAHRQILASTNKIEILIVA
jgi:hypothetical protein